MRQQEPWISESGNSDSTSKTSPGHASQHRDFFQVWTHDYPKNIQESFWQNGINGINAHCGTKTSQSPQVFHNVDFSIKFLKTADIHGFQGLCIVFALFAPDGIAF